MALDHPAWVEHQRRRFMRPDAQRYIRPDAQRFFRPGTFESFVAQHLERKYDGQPRVPAGNPEGGQWTDEGGAGGRNDPRIISDADPEAVRPGSQYAQNRTGRGGGARIRIGGREVELEPGQAACLSEVHARAEAAIARVRELDPNWRPPASAYETAEGLIRSREADAAAAQARASELGRAGIGPGPFARESIAARSSERAFTAAEREEINRIASTTGCHTCGVSNSGTRLGNFVPDHQPPNALNLLGKSQRLYPQCLSCSRSQGGWITTNRGRAK